MRWLGLILTTLTLVTFGPLTAQQAAFVGTVTDSITGTALSDVRVDLQDQDITAVTGPDGQFRLSDVRSGNLTILIRKPGFKRGLVQMEIDILGAVTVDLGTIPLEPLAVALDPVFVEDLKINQRLDRVGFYRRRNSEHGTFLTMDVIERRNPRNTSDLLLQIPAIRVAVEATGNSAYSARGVANLLQSGSTCQLGYYVDGVAAQGVLVDDVLPTSIAAIEVYAGPATIPPQFRYPSLNPKCGVVVIWTKTGRTER